MSYCSVAGPPVCAPSAWCLGASRGGLVSGLRVVDAGAMPLIPSGNTNAPVLMMAEKAARWVLAGE